MHSPMSSIDRIEMQMCHNLVDLSFYFSFVASTSYFYFYFFVFLAIFESIPNIYTTTYICTFNGVCIWSTVNRYENGTFLLTLVRIAWITDSLQMATHIECWALILWCSYDWLWNNLALGSSAYSNIRKVFFVVPTAAVAEDQCLSTHLQYSSHSCFLSNNNHLKSGSDG